MGGPAPSLGVFGSASTNRYYPPKYSARSVIIKPEAGGVQRVKFFILDSDRPYPLHSVIDGLGPEYALDGVLYDTFDEVTAILKLLNSDM